ncbi:MAG: hypothetical protein CMH30_03760 [Micavibrio sp.]|nr:hypothetical protein [Micavibrio sp.]|tara:strand:+ start:985 stop:1542 length:558 start_codon:yes stop_codon:yes gene_type:complete
MDDASIKNRITDLMNDVPQALIKCAIACSQPSLEPFTLRQAAAEYSAEQALEANLCLILANLMCDFEISEISYLPLKEFTENFITWLHKGDFNDVEWYYEPVLTERKKLEKLELSYAAYLKQYGAEVKDMPLLSDFKAASILHECALLINARPEFDQYRLRSALCCFIEESNKRNSSLALRRARL